MYKLIWDMVAQLAYYRLHENSAGFKAKPLNGWHGPPDHSQIDLTDIDETVIYST
jgi:hypothetical protein